MKTKINVTNELLYDHSTKMFVQVRLSQDKRYYEKWTSKDKKTWEISGTYKSIEEVIKAKEELINHNYQNLFKTITGI